MSVYRSHHAADDSRWHEIVGESGEQGEGCLITTVKAVGWAALAGAVIGLTLLGTFVTAFRWDLW